MRRIKQWSNYCNLLGSIPIEALHRTFWFIAIDRWVERVLFDGVSGPIKNNVPGWRCIKILNAFPAKCTLVASAYLRTNSWRRVVAVCAYRVFFANHIQIRRDVFRCFAPVIFVGATFKQLRAIRDPWSACWRQLVTLMHEQVFGDAFDVNMRINSRFPITERGDLHYVAACWLALWISVTVGWASHKLTSPRNFNVIQKEVHREIVIKRTGDRFSPFGDFEFRGDAARVLSCRAGCVATPIGRKPAAKESRRLVKCVIGAVVDRRP